LCKELESLVKIPKFIVSVDDFEKDDDSNNHIDFIHASSCLRGSNYSIELVDRLESKRISGKIIPAIATTTTVISGLVSIEFIKIIMNTLPIESFKNSFLNLGLPFYGLSEPASPKKIPISGNAFYTVWEKWVIKKPDMTVKEIKNHFFNKYGLLVNGIYHDVAMLYMSLLPNHQSKLEKPIKSLLKNIHSEDYVDLVLTFSDEKGKDINCPIIRFHLK